MSRNFELMQELDRHSELLGLADRRLPQQKSLKEHKPMIMPSPASEWLRAWSAIRNRWRVGAMFAAAVMIAVMLFTVLTKPVYEPVARVEIDPPGAELFSMEGRVGGDSSPEFLETQAQNMQSPALLVTVMRQLHLDQNREFKERGMITRVLGSTFAAVENVPNWIWGRKSSGSKPELPPGLEVLNPTEASTLRDMQSRLTVNRDTASHLVNVSFTTHDAALSAEITNTLVLAFIERTYQTRHDAIIESTGWLARQLDDIRTNMEQSNRALAQFQSYSGISDVDQNKSTVSEQMAELSRQKTLAQTDYIQIESYLRKARSGDIESLPQIQSNLVIQQLTQKLAETRSELSQTRAIYGQNHPNVRKLQNQIDELELQLSLQRKAIIGQMETSYTAALMREQMIDNQMRGTARELGQMAQYVALKKDAQVNSDLYNSLYARVKEAGIAAASKSMNIRLVDQARVLDAPTRPRPLVNFGFGLAAALIGGMMLIFIREALDTRIRTAEDILRSTGISAVSMMPIAEGRNPIGWLGSISSTLHLPQDRFSNEPVKFMLDQPGSELSEAIRGLRTAVMLSKPEYPPCLLLVASSVPGEGKTTVVINLATALAQQGKTCILDADLRRSSVDRAFHLSPEAGLGEYLIDSIPLELILHPVPGVSNLTLIAGGKPVSDPSALINSGKMRSLLRTLSTLYDFVVVDSPPILSYADGRALAPFVDGVVFVGRAGMVTRDAMARSLELLQAVHGAPVLEIVLNGVETENALYGYGYNYSRRAS